MKHPHAADPPRWRRAPAAGRSPIEAEIRSALGQIPEPEPADDFRLEQVRRRIMLRARAAARGAPPMARRLWLRTCALALACFVLGGLAMAAVQRIAARRARGPAAVGVPAEPVAAGTGRAGFRMAAAERPPIDVAAPPAKPVVGMTVGEESPRAIPEAPARGSPAPPSFPPPAPASRERPPVTAPAPARVEAHGPPRAGSIASAPAEASLSARGHDLSSLPPVALSFHAAPPAPSRETQVEPPPAEPRPPDAPPAAPARGSAPPGARADGATAEAVYVARALRALRTGRDPRAALTELDLHDRLFPRGLLGREAALARVEALMALGQGGAALEILDPLALSSVETDRRVSVLRAELRAAHQRCAEALADFDRALRTAVEDDVTARALYGRALCRARGGDGPGARDDLGRYLRRFPTAPDRAAAARELDRLTPNL